MTFLPMRGLKKAAVAFPVFFGIKSILEFIFSQQVDWTFNAIWAVAVAVVFGAIATFTTKGWV